MWWVTGSVNTISQPREISPERLETSISGSGALGASVGIPPWRRACAYGLVARAVGPPRPPPGWRLSAARPKPGSAAGRVGFGGAAPKALRAGVSGAWPQHAAGHDSESMPLHGSERAQPGPRLWGAWMLPAAEPPLVADSESCSGIDRGFPGLQKDPRALCPEEPEGHASSRPQWPR